jgi:hypothetical protein
VRSLTTQKFRLGRQRHIELAVRAASLDTTSPYSSQRAP